MRVGRQTRGIPADLLNEISVERVLVLVLGNGVRRLKR